MAPDRLQQQRFELKYFIPESLAEPIRGFVSCYLELDAYGVGKPLNSYAIHSIYLDSDDMALYWDTVNGLKNRYKLRLRYYTDDPKAPVFLEIKRRSNEAILKQRAGLRRIAAAALLRGDLPAVEDLVHADAKSVIALNRFYELMMRLKAGPKVHVAYLREAWVTRHDNSVRVTMDRDTRSEQELYPSFKCELRRALPVFGQEVILEIKFTGRFPSWLGEMVRAFGLERRSAAKYVDGVTLLNEDQQVHAGALAGDVWIGGNGLTARKTDTAEIDP